METSWKEVAALEEERDAQLAQLNEALAAVRRKKELAEQQVERECPAALRFRWPGTPYDEKSVFYRKLFCHFSQPTTPNALKLMKSRRLPYPRRAKEKILHKFRKRLKFRWIFIKTTAKNDEFDQKMLIYWKNQQNFIRTFANFLSFDRCAGMQIL